MSQSLQYGGIHDSHFKHIQTTITSLFPTAHASAHDQTLSQEDNGIADVKIVNSHGGALSTPDLSLTIYQQQMMLNHQMFLQQQQTVNALIGKVEGLAKIVNNRESAGKSDKSPRVSELKQTKSKRGKPHEHVLSDSDIEDVSSDEEEPGNRDYSSGDESDCNDSRKEEKQESEQKTTELLSDNAKLLQDLSKEFEKAEAVGDKVEDLIQKVVDTGIRAQIDRNLAKELCKNYKRPENCKALVVPKINKELWNTTSLAKSSKEHDKMYQTTQKYLNQGLIPLVHLLNNLLTGKDADNNFRLAKDAFQLLAYAHRDMSNLRRQRLKSVVAEKYRPLCNDSTPVTENLLGDDLEKQIKTLDEMRKVGMDLTKHKAEKRKHKSHDSYNRPAKYQKHINYYSGSKRDKNSFLEKKPRFNHKPDPHKNKKNHK